MSQRFPCRSRIMYDQLYDITGDVTGQYDAEPWDELNDDLLKQHIERDCIMF